CAAGAGILVAGGWRCGVCGLRVDGRLRVVMKSLIFPGSTFTSQFVYINFNTSSTIRLYTDRKD
ncbi:hypothetical protein ACUODJ_47890, partial [Escherichia sp. HC-CC]